METAKVDIRRLQLLNDRITQCLDALNQVRLSVHGLSHTGIAPEGQPGLPNTLPQDPRFATGVFGAQQIPGQIPAWGMGLAHSAPGYGAGYSPIAQGLVPGIPWQGAAPFAFGPPQTPLFGLSHSSPEGDLYGRAGLGDPFFAVKVAQTFPYARFGAPPPVVALY